MGKAADNAGPRPPADRAAGACLRRRRRPDGGGGHRLLFPLLLGAVLLAIAAPTASAAPSELWTACTTGSGAGQCKNPRGIAANPDNGHIYVSELGNNRVSELNALGQFVRAWGWGVDTGANALEVCTAQSGCQAGIAAAAAGALNTPNGIARDPAGDLYVIDTENFRVEKFDPKGNFLLMFGGEVNKTTGEDVCTKADLEAAEVCGKGVAGSGAGRFAASGEPRSDIAIDSTGNVYVGDVGRIQRFDTNGVYQGEIALPGVTVESVAVDAAGNLYAIYRSKPDVRKITAAGVELASPRFALPKLAEGKANFPTAMTVDSTGNVFAFGSTCFVCSGSPVSMDPITEFDPAGNVIDAFGKGEFENSTAMGANFCAGSEPPGNVYVANLNPPANSFLRAYGSEPLGCFKARTLPATKVEETTTTLNGTVDPSGVPVGECFFEYGTSTAYGQTAPCAESLAEIGAGDDPVPVHTSLSGLAKGTVYHFGLSAKVDGELQTGADESFKTKGPPVITDEHVLSATHTEASMRAQVNPEGIAATYHCQYVTQAAFEATGFESAQESVEIAIGSDRKEHAAVCNLEGLSPKTAYRWRFVATNSSGVTTSPDHGLTTYPAPTLLAPCPNDAFRGGIAAHLPDCRAYEMVSPIDKNGGDIVTTGEAGESHAIVRSSPSGDRLTYTARPSFAGQESSFNVNQYLATRGPGGWTNEGIRPPVEGQAVGIYLFGLTQEFMAFTPDLCNAWLLDPQTPPPSADGQPDRRNLYRRHNCAPQAGGLEALVPASVAVSEDATQGYVHRSSIGGVSDDGRHAVFLAGAKLTADASDAKILTGGDAPIEQVYDRHEGALSLVSVLPDEANGDPAPGDGQGFASPSLSGVGGGWAGNLEGAVSADGSRVYWASDFQRGPGDGQLHLRLHPEQGIVEEECADAAKACTIPVSADIAYFWGAAPDGSKALFSEGNFSDSTAKLYEFDLARAEAEEPPLLVAEDVRGVTAWSKDLSRVYFTSKAVPVGVGPNSEGDEAQSGEPNLYLAEGGEVSFIATLVPGDVGAIEPGALVSAYILDHKSALKRASRASADGARFAFNSRAQLTEFDNTAANGKAAVEVYLYDAEANGGAGELRCASCNPAGARPAVRELQRWGNDFPTKVSAAAWIPPHQQPLNTSNVLSADGDRLFFNSNDPLLPGDTNGAQDVYEWEAPGSGTCSEGSPTYFAQNGGCLYLISSGQSPEESEFWEASPDGSDVFFNTASSLLPPDPGLIDLYDARVGGGFIEPGPLPSCEGDACQSPPPLPIDPTPASASFRGPGDPSKGKERKRRCAKGTRKVRRKGKTRCESKRQKHKRANTNRRAAR